MVDQTKRNPRGLTGGDADKQSGGRCCTSHSTDLTARARRHDHGVLVLAERRDGVVTSQVYADLGAAERKVWRTREKGLQASLTLVRLQPVGHVDLDGIGGDR